MIKDKRVKKAFKEEDPFLEKWVFFIIKNFE
jgi:hypothetical protein